MTSRARRFLVALAGIAISVIALVIVVRSVDVGAAVDALAGADPRFIIVALGVYLVGLTLRVLRWSRLLPAGADGRRIAPRRILPVMMVGYLGNAVLPARLGEGIRAYLIARRERLPFGAAAGSVVLERIVDTAILAVLAFVGGREHRWHRVARPGYGLRGCDRSPSWSSSPPSGWARCSRSPAS